MPKKLAGLTPSQDLIVDLLVARHRLGEPFWPISTQLNRTYKILEEKGYVSVLSGHVDGTVRLMLTGQAVTELISKSSHMPPIARDLVDKISDELTEAGGDPTTIRMMRAKFGGNR